MANSILGFKLSVINLLTGFYLLQTATLQSVCCQFLLLVSGAPDPPINLIYDNFTYELSWTQENPNKIEFVGYKIECLKRRCVTFVFEPAGKFSTA